MPITDIVAKDTFAAVNDNASTISSALRSARAAIDQKCMQLGGAAGLPVGDVQFGSGDGYFRRYQNGAIYFLPPFAPCWVHGATLGKYLSLGADAGFLGYPTTDEMTLDGTGRYNHFERGSIYWTYGWVPMRSAAQSAPGGLFSGGRRAG